jgi:putative lipoprotein
MKIVAAIAVLTLLVVPACRRSDPGARTRLKAELAGAWVREIRDAAAGGLEGFDLRADGSVALLGIFSLNGIAWTVSRDELVISTNTDRYATPNPSRLRIVSLEGDVLRLDADPPDYLAGTWRRSGVEHVSGVVTYLERMALPPDARVEVRIARGERLLARTLISPKAAVPIPFTLSVLPEPAPDASGYALEARIFAADGPLFATPAPLPCAANATGMELLVRRSPASH